MGTITLAQLAAVLRERGVEPDQSFTAAAGRDYGTVEAWHLAPLGASLIVYGDNGETRYALRDCDDDLHEWLIFDGLNALGLAIQTANVLGIGYVEAATDEDDGPFYALETRYWYGRVTTDAVRDEHGRPKGFASFADACEFRETADSGIYSLGNNECARPTYTIICA